MNDDRARRGETAALVPRSRPNSRECLVDTQTVTETIRQATAPRLSIPTNDRIDHLNQRLRGHICLLLEELLGEKDEELHDMTGEAELLLKMKLAPDATRPQRWQHTEILAACAKGLLRRYEEAGGS